MESGASGTNRGTAKHTRTAARPPAPDPLPAPVTDTHCHLDIARWTGPDSNSGTDHLVDPAQALAEAAAVNVTRVVQIGTDVAGSAWATEAAHRFEGVVAGVALHPNEAPRLASDGDLDAALAEIDRLAGSSERVRAVGETGLDHFRTGPDGRAAQGHSFRAHLEIARKHEKALVIHDRDAHRDVLRVLADSAPPDRVVFHCFSGDVEMARHCAERGWFLSFAGTITFKNASGLRAALAETPIEQVLVETDAPYLTPHPYRGQINAPYLVPLTVRTVADVLGRDLEETCTALQANTSRAFGMW